MYFSIFMPDVSCPGQVFVSTYTSDVHVYVCCPCPWGCPSSCLCSCSCLVRCSIDIFSVIPYCIFPEFRPISHTEFRERKNQFRTEKILTSAELRRPTYVAHPGPVSWRLIFELFQFSCLIFFLSNILLV